MLALEGVATSEEPTVQQNMKYVGRLDAPRVRGVPYIPYHTKRIQKGVKNNIKEIDYLRVQHRDP